MRGVIFPLVVTGTGIPVAALAVLTGDRS